MQNWAINNGKMITGRMLDLEKIIINLTSERMKTGDISESSIEDISSSADEYFFLLCHKCSFIDISVRINSICRIVLFLITFPVKNRINRDIVISFYEKLSLLYRASYVLFQLSSDPVDYNAVNNFMMYIKESSVEKLYAFYLYRVCPEKIRQEYIINPEKLNENELYHAIASGYYELGKGECDAVKRLYGLGAQREINMLKTEGFAID